MKYHILWILLLLILSFSGCETGQRSDGSELTLAGADEETETGESPKSFHGSDTESDPVSETAYGEEDTIVVYICGCVNAPGVYELASGSRLYELLDRCAGLSHDAAGDTLNLAEPLSDGERIYVPSVSEAAPYEAASEGNITDDRININTADASLLMTINGIGQSRAADIVAYREANGPFRSVEDIMQVSGIKEGLYAKIKDRIRI